MRYISGTCVQKNLHLANKGDGASELLVHHKAKDAHHSGTAIVELDATLLELGLLIKGIPTEVKGAVAEITGELSLSGNILHDGKLKSANEENDLNEAALRDGVRTSDGSPTVGKGVEGVTGVVNVTGKVDAGTGDDLAKEGKLTDTSVLDLDVTKAVETLLVGILKKAKRIEETKRGLNSKLTLEGVEGGGGLANLGRGEGGGRTSKKGGDGKLVHGWI
mmetsp:Transcript_28964/g.63813  ORF Transcript_28964/g.63813 Transcript_28964/m.63813 type:complete len:220 (-) Transcript_28964:44-703(-)